MKKVKGILVNADDNLLSEYKLLKNEVLKVLQNEEYMWNWPMLIGLTRPSLGRILQLQQIYELILDTPGSVCEFGVHYGASSNILMNLKSLLEPHNSNRRFFLFDTFQGFVGVNEKDGLLVAERDFTLIQSNYDEVLTNLLQLQNRIRDDHHDISFQIFKGNGPEKFEQFLRENPHTVFSCLFFDMDIYAPTKKILELAIPRLTKGSLVVFDQFNCDLYPGETVAAMEVLDLCNLKMFKSKFTPHTAWFRQE